MRRIGLAVVITLNLLLSPPLAVDAQPSEEVYRIGMLERTAKTINAASLNGFSSVLTQAVEDGILAANPAFRLGRYYRHDRNLKAEIQPLSRDEAGAFLGAVHQHASAYYAVFLCALRTGMRLGELLGLQWGDVDFHGRFIEVRRNLVAGRLTTPKSGKTRRVDMSVQLAETLKTLLTTHKAQTLKNGWGNVPDWASVARPAVRSTATT